MLGNPRPARRPSLRLHELEQRDVPAIIPGPDVYSVAAGTVLTVPFNQGLLSNDYSTLSFGASLGITNTTAAQYVGLANPPALPNPPIVNQNGSFTFIAPPANIIPAGVTQVSFQYSVVNLANPADNGTGFVLINLQAAPTRYLAVGADVGGGPRVRVFEAGTGIPKFDFFAYEPTFTGGVRVAVGDLNRDGTDDIVTVPAYGGAVRVKVYDGKDLTLLYDNYVFEPTFVGGAYVAVGDFTGDRQNDIIIGAGEGGGSRVKVISPDNTLAAPFSAPLNIADFYAYDPALQTGVRVAAGDLNADGTDSIVTAPGVGGGPHVRTFDLLNIVSRTQTPAPSTLSFFAGDANDRFGVYVAVGQFSGNGLGDIVTGSGTGPGVVQVFNGRTGGVVRQFGVPNNEVATGGGTPGGPSTFLFQTGQPGVLLSPTTAPNALAPAVNGVGIPLVNQTGQGLSFSNQTGQISGGVRVATSDWDGDGVDDIVTGAGPANAPRVRVFNTLNQQELASLLSFSANFLGGINVAAT